MTQVHPPPRPVPLHTRCATCAYDLAGLTTDLNCPECNTSIEHSMKADLFAAGPIPYLRSLRRALAIALAFLVAHLALVTYLAGLFFIAILGASRAAGTPFLPAQLSTTIDIATYALSAITIICTIFLFIGIWEFTAPNPIWRSTNLDPKRRYTVRIALTLFTIASLVACAARFFAPATLRYAANRRSLTSFEVEIAASITAAILLTPLLMALMYYCRTLAARLHEKTIASGALILAWVIPLCMLTMLCMMPYFYIIAASLPVVILLALDKSLYNAIRWRHRNPAPFIT